MVEGGDVKYLFQSTTANKYFLNLSIIPNLIPKKDFEITEATHKIL